MKRTGRLIFVATAIMAIGLSILHWPQRASATWSTGDELTAANLNAKTDSTSSATITLDSDNAGAGADTSILFNRGSTDTDAALVWDETNDRFYVKSDQDPTEASIQSAGAYSSGTYTIDSTSVAVTSTSITLDSDNAGAAAAMAITFNRGSSGTDVSLTWDEANDRVVLSDPDKALTLGTIQSAGVYIADAYTVDSTSIAATGTSIMLDSNNVGAEVDQFIYFQRGSTSTDAYIQWDATNNRFAIVEETGKHANLQTEGLYHTSLSLATDGTGDAEITLSENSVGPDEVAVAHDWVISCGELAEAGTIYFGPATAPTLGDGSTSYALTSAGCDGLDNADEATADGPITNLGAIKVTGLWCTTDATLGAAETIVFTVRSAVADLTPTVTCTISEAQTSCRSLTGSTTDIAAGATIAVKAVETSDNGDGDEAWCKIFYALK